MMKKKPAKRVVGLGPFQKKAEEFERALKRRIDAFDKLEKEFEARLKAPTVKNWVGSFGWALEAMRGGQAVKRPSWGKARRIYILEGNKIIPWIVCSELDQDSMPWSCPQQDLLARDWELAGER